MDWTLFESQMIGDPVLTGRMNPSPEGRLADSVPYLLRDAIVSLHTVPWRGTPHSIYKVQHTETL